MSELRESLEAFETDAYKDELVRRLIFEERRSRQGLLHVIRGEFEDYFDRIDAPGDMVFHRDVGDRSVRHSIVFTHRYSNRPYFFKLWTEELSLDVDSFDDRSVLVIAEEALAISAHGLAFRVMKKDKRQHPSGSIIETYSQTPSRAYVGRHRNPSDDDFLREFAGAPVYLDGKVTLPELLNVRRKLYGPLGVIMSLGSDTEVEHIPDRLEDRVFSL